MTISDYINLLAIIVAIVVGFFITHWYSVRDTRTRVIKDFYIEQIKSIKGRVDQYLRKLVWGTLSARQFISWYYNIDLDIKGLDKGLRYSLDIRRKELGKIIGDAFDVITNLEDFNNQFSANKVSLGVRDKEIVKKTISNLDDDINMYIAVVNHANTYGLFTVQKKKMAETKRYYEEIGHRYPMLKAWQERLQKHWKEITVFFALFIGLTVLYCKLKSDKEESNPHILELVDEIKQIRRDQDTIASRISDFSQKYQPNVVFQKKFEKSSFFQANNIDSVHVKIYNSDEANE